MFWPVFLVFSACLHYAASGRVVHLDVTRTWNPVIRNALPSVDQKLMEEDPVLYYSLITQEGKSCDVESIIQSLKKLVKKSENEKNFPQLISYLQS